MPSYDYSKVNTTVKLLCRLPHGVWMWLETCKALKEGLAIGTQMGATDPNLLSEQWLYAGLIILCHNPHYDEKEKLWTSFDDSEISDIVSAGNSLLDVLRNTIPCNCDDAETKVDALRFEREMVAAKEYAYTPTRLNQYFMSRFYPFVKALPDAFQLDPHALSRVELSDEEIGKLVSMYARAIPEYPYYIEVKRCIDKVLEAARELRDIISGNREAQKNLVSPAHILLESNVRRYVFAFSSASFSIFKDGYTILKDYQHKPGFPLVEEMGEDMKERWKPLFDYLYKITKGAREITRLIRCFHEMVDSYVFRIQTMECKGLQFDNENYDVQFDELLKSFDDAAAVVGSATFNRDEPKIAKACEMAELAESPLVKKYIAWGAENVEAVPRYLLKITEGDVPKAVFEKNLKVKAQNCTELLEKLNANVKGFMDDAWMKLCDVMEDCYHNRYDTTADPIKLLLEDMQYVRGKSISFPRHGNWATLLATALAMPRLSLYYHLWNCPDEGPSEPGLRYTLLDGMEVEIYYDVPPSQWDDQIRDIEDYISEAIKAVTRKLENTHNTVLLNEWAAISQAWDDCYDGQRFRHCTGDLKGFSDLFYKSWTKLCKHPKLLETAPSIKHQEQPMKAEIVKVSSDVQKEYEALLDKQTQEIKSHITAEANHKPSATATQSNPPERTTKIASPDFKERDSCEIFCKRLFAELKEKKKDSLHTAREIVYYMLHGAKEGELYYDDCLVARRIQKEWNWELPTFTTYCKRKNIPTPKGISRAAKKRSTQKRVRRDLRGL